MSRGPEPVLLAGKDSPRARVFVEACRERGLSVSQLSYAEFLDQPDRLTTMLRGDKWLRVDSPDRDFHSLAALYTLGVAEADQHGYPVLDAKGLVQRLAEPGTIGSPAQLFFGLRTALEKAERIADAAGAVISHRSVDVARAHDKIATHAHLAQLGVSKPDLLGPILNFDTLLEKMRNGMHRVFLKLRHGSAAAGMIALAVRRDGQMKAVTTGILADDGTVRSTRALQTLTDRTQIETLVNALAPFGLFAERWVPKATVGPDRCDLRIVSVGDRLFPLLRQSKHPMTNLHLGGDRASVDALRDKMDPADWTALEVTTRRVVRSFPGAMSLGLDVAVLTGYRRHAVLEVNAFGDFVKDLSIDGITPAAALVSAASGMPALVPA